MARDTQLLIRLTKEEKHRINAAAEAYGEAAAVWIRFVLRQAVDGVLGPVLAIPEIVKVGDRLPNGSTVIAAMPAELLVPEIDQKGAERAPGPNMLQASPEEVPIPEIGGGPVYPVQHEGAPVKEQEPFAESGRFVDGEWVPD